MAELKNNSGLNDQSQNLLAGAGSQTADLTSAMILPEFRLGRNFEGKKGAIDQDMLASERLVVAVYFAASFCNPTRAFTPKLVEFYNEVNVEEKLLEIILVPFDRTEEDAKKFFKTMPWISLPFDIERIEAYRNFYAVKGVPHLVVLDSEGNVLIHDAGKEVLAKGEDAFTEWTHLLQEKKNLLAIQEDQSPQPFEQEREQQQQQQYQPESA